MITREELEAFPPLKPCEKCGQLPELQDLRKGFCDECMELECIGAGGPHKDET